MSQRKRVLIAALVVFAILLVIAIKTNRPSPSTGEETPPPAEITKALSSTEEPKKAAADSRQAEEDQPNKTATTAGGQESQCLPRFVEIGAKKCIPCRMMQPILEDLRKEYAGKLRVDFVDVWEHPEQARKYGVQQIPTQVIYDSSGEEVFRHIGFWPKEQIVTKLADLGVK